MWRLLLLVNVVVAAASIGIGLEPFLPNCRIVGGTDADIRQYPHQISLRYNGIHDCGGSIIAANIIVTAAHCVIGTDATLLTIVAGSTLLSEKKWELAVIKYIIHDNYNRLNYDYDVAILVLRGQLPFNEFVQPIPLAKELVPAGTEVIVTGWVTLIESGSTPDHLQQVRVNVVDPAICRKAYPLSLTNRMLCVGLKNGEKDACEYDTGGPLIVNKQLLGVATWGVGRGRKNFPVVYASVPDMYDWIVKNAAANRIAVVTNAEANQIELDNDNFFIKFLVVLLVFNSIIFAVVVRERDRA